MRCGYCYDDICETLNRKFGTRLSRTSICRWVVQFGWKETDPFLVIEQRLNRLIEKDRKTDKEFSEISFLINSLNKFYSGGPLPSHYS